MLRSFSLVGIQLFFMVLKTLGIEFTDILMQLSHAVKLNNATRFPPGSSDDRHLFRSVFNFREDYRGLTEYVPPPTTTEQLDWADLAIIDLSKADTLEGRKALADEVVQAMNTQGFFYVVNHGYTVEQTRRTFSIASSTFDDVDNEEKKMYMGKSPAVYEGYKPRQTWQIEQGVTDQIEHYNINHDVRNRMHPGALRPHLDEIEKFSRHNHTHILFTILRLMAMGMQLPEDTFVDMHRFEAPGESSVRFMKYYPRSPEEELQTKNVWLKGHTDIGSITILWSQPISGLQILSPDGVWRYIRHVENALVVNSGDVMQLLSGNFYKPTIHRVIQPPKDQEHMERLGVFYFAMAADDVKLASVRAGAASESEKAHAPTMSDWRKERTERYGTGSMKPSSKEEKVEEEVILGVVVKEYN
ncbi:Clavaminate synthase-like protein [Lentinula edodes]|uniref:Clavaminate synthase-like protein n=1 Tax=Lentinula edodes TaxID=5353 RepID=A0A1Q3DUQ2_LENED|nr:Clavaminate synthase-like protein [Lentinula edodes]